MKTHYMPSSDGYTIIGSKEFFNRGLYGGHGNDQRVEKFFTLAGDQPIVMGAVTDWRAQQACMHAKCGVFMAGVALTPGVSVPVFSYDQSGERTSQWFHDSPGTETTFRNGWMEHRVWPFFQCFPRVSAYLEVFPLQAHDGFLVTIRVESEQRIHLVLGLGGVTDYIGRFEAPYVERREFTRLDCVGNTVITGERSAAIVGSSEISTNTTVRMATNLPVTVGAVDSGFTATPGIFLGAAAILNPVSEQSETAPMIRMDCIVEQYQPLEGHVVVLRNATEDELFRIVDAPEPAIGIKREIIRKRSEMRLSSPDQMLDLTVPANILAMDACWQDKAFYHGAYAWHAPYIGWRNWYGPTVLGWHERVQQAFRTHAETQVQAPEGEERVEYKGPGQYSSLINSYGYLPEIPDGRTKLFYDMQEIGVDMILHSIEWTGDLSYAEEVFDAISGVLDWEKRILDSDDDGLYQNWLNTWISDAHSYNGGGCAQSSAYNYSANLRMAKIAELIGRDPEPFSSRALQINKALHRILWIPEKGVVAEYIDTVGNKLIHPSPELATIYHCIEADIVDKFQAYQMLRFTETDIRNEQTVSRGGRLVWSSNWLPQNYSSCGLYPTENIHLAWAYYQCGLAKHANAIMTGIVDTHYLSRFPGLVAHCLSPQGYSSGSSDFSEISSMMLRTVVEGLFGIRVRLLDGFYQIAPNFPLEWDAARLDTKDVCVDYLRTGSDETLRVSSDIHARCILRMSMRNTGIDLVTLDGEAVEYSIEPGIGRSDVVVEASITGEATLRIVHSGDDIPSCNYPRAVPKEQSIVACVEEGGTIIDLLDPSGLLSDSAVENGRLVARTKGIAGHHTAFLRVRKGLWDGWIPMDINVVDTLPDPGTSIYDASISSPGVARYSKLTIDKWFNCELTGIHQLEYRSPRPDSYSIMTQLNGRFGWDWNHQGHNVVKVDDTTLRNAGGAYSVPSGVPFITPAKGLNVACISVWDNFPDEISFPLSGSADAVAVFFIGVTNPMQSRVENGRFTVRYTDGAPEVSTLVNPDSFDDWLNAALQTRHETAYFNDYNHGTVVRIVTDPSRELADLTVSAVANEVIIGIIGITAIHG